MNFNTIIKTVKPHLLALLLFAALSLVYCYPMLQGMELIQHDKVQAYGMQQEARDCYEKTGEYALWTNAMFGGMPTYQIWVGYPGNLLNYLIRGVINVFPSESYLVFLLLTGFYILGYVLSRNVFVSIIGAIGFAFGSFNMIGIEAGHLNKVRAMAIVAPIMAGIIYAYRKNVIIGVVITTIALSLQLRSNHFQITYYTLFAAVILFIFFAIDYGLKNKIPAIFKPTALLLIGGLLAIGTNTTQLWTTYEYSKHTIRGGHSELTENLGKAGAGGGLDVDYAFSWSYGIDETMTLIIPRFMGGASAENVGEDSKLVEGFKKKGVPDAQAKQISKNAPTYWGDQPFTSGPFYFGAALFFLMVLGMLLSKNNIKWAMFAGLVITIMLSWGKNFGLNYIVFDIVPMYNKFRTPTMILTLTNLFFVVLAVMGLSQLLKSDNVKTELLKKTKLAFYITAGSVVFFGLILSAVYGFSGTSDAQLIKSGWPIDVLKDTRADMLRKDSFRSLFFIAATFGLVWFFINQKLKTKQLLIGLAVIIFFDLVLLDFNYFNKEDYVSKRKSENYYTPTVADQQILQDPAKNYRVLDLARNTFNSATASYYHKTVGGYHAAKLRRYQELIEKHIHTNMQQLNKGFDNDKIPVLNMLNTKYILIGENNQVTQAIPNPNAMGNAWLVNEIKVVENADEEIASLSAFDPGKIAFVDKRYADKLPENKTFNTGNASIELVDYNPNALQYQSKASGQQFAVFSEIFYDKGWKAYIDGQEAPIVRVNYVLRGMVIPDGNHEIKFEFKPKSYFLGNKISFASSIIILILLGFTVFKKTNTQVSDKQN